LGLVVGMVILVSWAIGLGGFLGYWLRRFPGLYWKFENGKFFV